MKLSVVLYEPSHEAAVQAFNQRMRKAHAKTAFLLPERSGDPLDPRSSIESQYLAVDATGAVRGGLICWNHRATFNGQIDNAINMQSPLSEGIIDPDYILVAPLLFKFALRQTPYVYAAGMGSTANPFARVLEAMGWNLQLIPFFFRMLRPAECIRQLSPLRNSRLKKLAGAFASLTGLATLSGGFIHRASATSNKLANSFQTEPIVEWGSWASTIWEAFASELSFSVLRDQKLLPFFYSFRGRGPQAWLLKRGGTPEGWFGLLISKMHGNAYFGNLTVAILTDCVGSAEAVQAGPLLAVRIAKQLGADLLITNQLHSRLRQACLAAGWRTGPSNYVLATSKALTKALREESTYITRRDGDGLANLMGSEEAE